MFEWIPRRSRRLFYCEEAREQFFLWLSALRPPFLIYPYAQIHYNKAVMFN